MVEIHKHPESYTNVFLEHTDKNPYFMIKDKLKNIENMLVSYKCKNGYRVDTKYTLPKSKSESFFNEFYSIVKIYWEWIDSHGYNYIVKKFIAFCYKAYPQFKVNFNSVYKIYKRVEKEIPRSYAVILNNEENKILMLKNVAPNNMKVKWCLPGGKLEIDETHMEALKRELKEELGLEIDKNDIIESVNFCDSYRSYKVYKIVIPEEIGLQCKPINPYEIENIEWVPLNTECVLTASNALKVFNIKN